jgi:hypothetical protein
MTSDFFFGSATAPLRPAGALTATFAAGFAFNVGFDVGFDIDEILVAHIFFFTDRPGLVFGALFLRVIDDLQGRLGTGLGGCRLGQGLGRRRLGAGLHRRCGGFRHPFADRLGGGLGSRLDG